ncbi:MAG: hypothetical protein U1E53_04570 [Dongiaceae bacterium]
MAGLDDPDDPPDGTAEEAIDIAEVERAYEAAGGDLEAADRRLAELQQMRTEAFAAILRALARAYRMGALEGVGDEQLASLAAEGQELTRNWAVRDRAAAGPAPDSALGRLLDDHERIADELLEAIEEIVWPYARLQGL